jgi:hypothetical protein
MKQNLDELKNEIAILLEEGGFAVFHAIERSSDPTPTVRWDYQQYPEPRLFIEAARKIGIRVMVFHHRLFESQAIEEASDDLKASSLPREQQRDLERQLRKFHDYDGFTCMLEMSFVHEGVTYVYQLLTPWFDEFLEISGEIQDALEAVEEDDDDDRGPMGGYFSHN